MEKPPPVMGGGGEPGGPRAAIITPREKIAAELLESCREEGQIELVSRFSNQFPIRVISNMLGLPREDEERFVGRYQALIAGLGRRRTAGRCRTAGGG